MKFFSRISTLLLFQLKLLLPLFFVSVLGKNPMCENKKYTLENSVDVTLHEDFRTPLAIVGIIFHTGSFDEQLSQKGITELIAANFISRETHIKLLELGVSYQVNVYGSHTEIIAKINLRNIKEFLQIICKNDFSPNDLEIMKKQMIINNNLAHSCFEDAVANEIFANISYKGCNISAAFNERILSSISLEDMREYFRQHYEKCRLSVIVSGAIGEKDLRQALQSTVNNLPSRQSHTASVCTNQIQKEIYIESKHIGRSVQYFYKIPSEDLVFAEAFFRIFHYELFNFFEKANQLISDYESFYVISSEDCIRQIVLCPKSDVSLATIRQMYDIFVERICKREIPTSIFLKIQQLKEFSNQFLLADLNAIYRKIKSDNLNGLNTEMSLKDSKLFNVLGKKFLKSNLILKIITRYKPDK
ncbi:MAG: hypothetical protein LBC04_03110 [Holosporaceae bacterium]|jgi:predicted Zn-dependent peptidase|nr:hypothetical protein [Holosporaceae bacterium]